MSSNPIPNATKHPSPPIAMQEKHQHMFLLDEADLQRMETGLLNLLDQFNKGELRAFGKFVRLIE